LPALSFIRRSLIVGSWVVVCLALGSSAVAEDSPATPAAKEPSAVTLRVGSWDDVQKRVAAHRGKVVLVDVWTTTCGTCREELPKLMKLADSLPADRVACIAVACDYDGIAEKPPEFYRAKVEQFLAEHKSQRTEHILLNIPFIEFLEQRELGSTPAVYLYGPDGKLVKRFDNDAAKRVADEYTLSQVQQAIAEQLKK
jgi:thiol-disulfide isomerase/thioredoxin